MSHPLLPVVPLPTFSEWPRVMHCIGSAVLPRTPVPPTDDSARGTAIHLYLALVPSIGPAEALKRVPEEWRDDCAAIELDGLPLHASAVQEMAVALDIGTGHAREIGRMLDRDYGVLSPTEIAGTVDIAWRQDGTVYTLDVKTGWRTQEPAAKHWQLLLQAITFARLWDCSDAVLLVVNIREDGTHHVDAAKLDTLELLAAEDKVVLRAQEIARARTAYAQGVMPEVVPGEHCRYCPAYAACPANLAIARRVMRDPASFEPPLFGALTVEQQRQVVTDLRHARQVLGRIEAEVKAYAAYNLIDLGEGRVYGGHEVARQQLDGATVFRVVKEKHGLDAALAAVTMTASKAGLERAVRAAGVKPMAPAVASLLAAVRAEGGVTEKKQQRIEEHEREDPGPARAA